MKLEHITGPNGDFFEITDIHGSTISLSPEDALLVGDWINHRRGDLFEMANQDGAPSWPQKVPLYDDDDIPEFTEQEALLLCDALNGVRCTPGTLHGNIAGAMQLGAAERYSVDGPAFLARIDALTEVQAQAVIDAVGLYWRGPYRKSGAEVYRSLYEVGLVKSHPSATPQTFTQQTKPGASTRFHASWVDDLEI